MRNKNIPARIPKKQDIIMEDLTFDEKYKILETFNQIIDYVDFVEYSSEEESIQELLEIVSAEMGYEKYIDEIIAILVNALTTDNGYPCQLKDKQFYNELDKLLNLAEDETIYYKVHHYISAYKLNNELSSNNNTNVRLIKICDVQEMVITHIEMFT